MTSMQPVPDLELSCTCCGDVAAVADDDGEFTDGQPLECGCSGWVAVEEGSPPVVHIDPEGCDRCAGWPEEDE